MIDDHKISIILDTYIQFQNAIALKNIYELYKENSKY